MKSPILIILFVFSSTLVNAQFQQCNSPTTKNLNDVYFADALVGVAVGDSGIIIRSSDGGLNWNIVLSVDTIGFKKVKFFDTQIGLAIGSHIYRTTDGGITWNYNPLYNYNFTDLEIVNDSTCYISGTPAKLIKSTDAGNSFTDLNINSNLDLGLISFVNNSIGYACGLNGGFSTKTLKTTDGGLNWLELNDTSQTPNPTVMEAMSFVSEDVGFKAGWYNPHLQKTSNGAHKWNNPTLVTTVSQWQLLDLHIEANLPNAYYACGWYGEIFKSVNGGNTWFELSSGINNTTSLYGIYFIDNNTGWVVGAHGIILKTTSGGIGINELENEIGLKIYPNPATDKLYVSLEPEVEVLETTVFDLHGRSILIFNKIENGLNISSLPKGTFILNIKTQDGTFNKKFIKL